MWMSSSSHIIAETESGGGDKDHIGAAGLHVGGQSHSHESDNRRAVIQLCRCNDSSDSPVLGGPC